MALLRELGWEAVEALRLGDSHGVSAQGKGEDVAQEFWWTEDVASALYDWVLEGGSNDAEAT